MQKGMHRYSRIHVTLWDITVQKPFLQKSFSNQYTISFGKICKDFIPEIFVIYNI